MAINPLPGRRVTAVDHIRTPFGAIPEGLLHQFGVFDHFVRLVAQLAPARCTQCEIDVPRFNSESIRRVITEAHRSRAKQEGGFFVVTGPATDEIPLLEYMELLGAVRAVVSGQLVSIDELEVGVKGSHGESLPVLLVARAEEIFAVTEKVEEWLARGGDNASIFYFTSRASQGEALATVSHQNLCPTCKEVCVHFDPDLILQDAECKRCKGLGYFDTVSIYGVPILDACPDCGGSGGGQPIPKVYFLGRPLVLVSELKVNELSKLCKSEQFTSADSVKEQEDIAVLFRVIEVLARSPLAEYSVGTPLVSLSVGERAVVTVLQAQMTEYSGAPLIVNTRHLGIESKDFTDFMSAASAANPAIELLPQPNDVFPGVSQKKPPSLTSRCSISMLSEISSELASFSFPFGAATLVVGGISNVAKDLLFEGIYKRFAKRRKLSTVCDFLGCTEAYYIALPDVLPSTVGDLIGVLPEISALYASTATAAKLGVSSQDLLRFLESYEQEEIEVSDSASATRGWQLASLAVNEVSLAELLSKPLSEAVDAVVLNDGVDELIRKLLPKFSQSITLGTSARELSWDTIVEVYYRARVLLAVASIPTVKRASSSRSLTVKKGKVNHPLIIVENPFRCSLQGCESIVSELDEATQQGSTVVCSGAIRGSEHAQVFQSYFAEISIL